MGEVVEGKWERVQHSGPIRDEHDHLFQGNNLKEIDREARGESEIFKGSKKHANPPPPRSPREAPNITEYFSSHSSSALVYVYKPRRVAKTFN